jgi:hypothetical protein
MLEFRMEWGRMEEWKNDPELQSGINDVPKNVFPGEMFY